MLNVTRLLQALDGSLAAGAAASDPRWPRAPEVVVWNVTRRCNLRCAFCYAAARRSPSPGELTTTEAVDLLADLAGSGARSLVLSGGEPLLRDDLLELAGLAAGAGLRVALSTNGTLIDGALAGRLAAAGVDYVGVSLDGRPAVHDLVRGRAGAFAAARRGLRAARQAGIRVGVRFTLCRATLAELEAVLDLMEAEEVDRGYVSHLVQVGRAHRLSPAALAPEETRQAVETIFDRAERWRRTGRRTELVTGNNDADGVALYLRLRQRSPEAAVRARLFLMARGGNASGVAIAGVDDRGNVHPDQFWTAVTLGNVRERPLSAIWRDPALPLLAALRQRRRPLRGRCAACPFLDLCGGGSRARAQALTGDLWAPDPACHLTAAELGCHTEGEADGWGAVLARGAGDSSAGGECAAPGPGGD